MSDTQRIPPSSMRDQRAAGIATRRATPVLARLAVRVAVLVLVAGALTCGGGEQPAGASSIVRGRAWLGGPVADARVEIHQLVDGTRTRLLATTTTAADGAFEATVEGYEHFEIVVEGGRYAETRGGATITMPAGQVLRGVVLDVVTGSTREDVAVTPFTDVMLELARARAARGERFNDALLLVHDRLAAHLDFDPTETAIASLDGPLAATADDARHALALAGLSTMASIAAADLRVTAQDVSTLSFLRELVTDASSAEARLDGNVGAGGVAPLHVGASCPADMPGDRASCRVHSNTLRARLAHGVLAYLVSQDNHTGLARPDVLAWVSELAANDDGELFGGDPVDDVDAVGPRVTFVRPADGAAVAGVTTVEVTADDDLGVDRIAVQVVAAGTEDDPAPVVLAALADTAAAPDRFTGDLDTVPLAEGAVVLVATATDVSGIATRATRTITVNNVQGGTISGVVVKGRVEGATVRIYGYAGGVRGALLGEGTTGADGSFTNVALADGYAGPLLVEAGFGGHYGEEAGPATVTFDVADALRTIVPSYADGGAPANVVVSPLTSFAVRLREQLAAAAGVQDVAAQWQQATAALETHFGVANLRSVTPLRPEEMVTLTAGARYGLVLVGLSELARQASTAGGGDAGTFGVAVSALKVWKLWQQDLDDGCWNGRAGAAVDAPRLFYGGTQALGDDPTRRALANAIAGYVTSPRNATPFAGIADVLPLLDAITTGGGALPAGACPGGTLLPPTAAVGFDQDAPVITVTPAEPMPGVAPVVRGAVPVVALAVDPGGIDPRPTLRVTGPAGFVGRDDDGDDTDADVRFTIDTPAEVGPEGTLDLVLETVDDSSNHRSLVRRLVIDNLAPAVTVDGVTDGGAYPPPRTIEFAAVDSHLASVTATLDGAPFVSGAAVIAPGPHTFTVVARDAPGNMTTVTRAFRIDGDAPVITINGVTHQGFYRPPVTITYAAADADLDTVGATLDGAPFASGTVVATEGAHTLVVTARDHAGNVTDRTVQFTLDGTDPVITVAGVDHQGVHAPPVTITFDAADVNLASVTATLDGAPFVSGVAVAATGDHVLIVTARDRAGNQAQVTRAFALDGTAPAVTITGVVDQGFHAPPVTIGFAALDPHLASVSATLDGLPIIDGTVVPFEGPHDLVVTAVDRAGNQTRATRHFTLDGTAPVITLDPDLQPGGFYRRQAAVTFAGADLNLASVTATLDGQPFNSGNAINADGERTLRVVAVDRAGNTTTLERTFTIDGIAPLVTVTGVVEGGFYQPGAATITFSQNDVNAGTLTATLDGAPFVTGTAVGGADGPRQLIVTAVDRAGNTTIETRNFTIDGTRPVVTLDPDLQDGGFYPRQAAVAFAGADLNLLSVTATLDAQPFNSGNAIAVDGAHTLVVMARDRAGNWTTVTRAFIIDGVPPVITVTGIVDGGFYRPGAATVIFSQDDANPGPLTATLDGAPFAGGTAVGGADGARVLVVTAVDRAGNQASKTINFTIDGTPPTVTLDPDLQDGGFYPRQPAVAFVGADANLQSVTATLDGQAFNSGNAIALDGEHTLVVMARDRAGNWTTVTRAFTIDGTPPVLTINGVQDGGFYRPGVATITFSQQDANPGTLTATLDGAPFASGTTVAGADGARRLVVTAIDRAGNTTIETRNFTIDGTPPVVTLDPDLQDGGYHRRQAAVTFAAADANLQAVSATLDGQPFNSGNAIAADGAHTLIVTGVDRAGNQTVVTRSFTIDGIAPAITVNGVVDGGFYRPGVATITFNQNDANPGSLTATLDGAPFASGGVVGGADGPRVLVVTATDRAGNQAVETRTFTIDGTPPVLSVASANQAGPWVRAGYQVTVVADDGLAASGSLGVPIAAIANGANGALVATGTVPSVLPGGQRQLQVTYDTVAAGPGALTVTFTVSDRAGNAAPPLQVLVNVDNTPPDVSVAAVRDDVPPQVDGYLRGNAATVRGTVAPLGGAPTTVTVTITNIDLPAPIVGQTSPDGTGAWTFTTPVLASSAGTYSVTAAAADAAGNIDASPAATSFRVDRTGPAVTLAASPVLDEATRCTVTVNVDTSGAVGAITNAASPVTYNCGGATTDLSAAGVTVSKYVTRLGSSTENPLRWNLSTVDEVNGVQVANADTTVRMRIYRQGQAAPATWVAGKATGYAVSTLTATIDALSTDWPELQTHTATFVMEVEAQDRLGNWGPRVSRTWTHRPLAPPVSIVARGEAPKSGNSGMYPHTADLYPYSIFRNSLTPDATQQGLGDAMSGQLGGQIAVDAPRALYVFDLFNPHATPINVGFFIPVVANASYTRRVWDTSPWVNDVDPTYSRVATPALNLCGWRSGSWKALLGHQPAYDCNTKSCTCNNEGWTPPTDSTPGTAATTAALPDGTFVVRAVDLSVAQGQLLPRQNLALNIEVAQNVFRPFFEYTIPARADANNARRIRIIIAVDMSFFAPYANPAEGIEESDGPGAESFALPGGYTPVTTSSYYERWGECRFKDNTNPALCATGVSNGIRVRRRVRTLVEARVQVPQGALKVAARTRADAIAASALEPLTSFPDSGLGAANQLPFLWDTCESTNYVAHSGNPCSPIIATTFQSQ